MPGKNENPEVRMVWSEAMARPPVDGRSGWRPRQNLTWVFTVSTLLAVSSARASPQIEHTPPKPASGEDLTIRARIAGAEGDVFEPYVSYRTSGPTYTVVSLKHQSGSDYEAVIPSDALTGVKFEYYLGAYDSKDLSEGTWRSPANPQKLALPFDEEVEHIDKVAKPEKSSKKKKREEKSARSRHKKETEKEEEADAPPKRDAAPVAPKLAAADPTKRNFDDLPPIPTNDETAPAPVTKPAVPLPAAAATATTATADAAVVPPPPPPKAPSGPLERPVDPPAGMPAGSGFIRVVTDPPGAAVNFDGTDLGPAPVEKTMAEADILVMARLTGYRQVSRVVTVKAGGGKEVKLTLKPR